MPSNSKLFQSKVKTQSAVTLVGGGAFGARDLARALAFAPYLVAADGGANRLLALNAAPRAVIGDLDSINSQARAAFAAQLIHVPAQDDTDFDKCLAAIDAPFVVGLGFVGARMDHGLAVLAGLLRRPDLPVFLLGGRDVIFLAPPRLTLDLPRGARVSLFPFGAVTGRSTGLDWPIEGISFAPDAAIGTSNRASGGQVALEFSACKMLVILPRAHLIAAIKGCGFAPAGALPAPVRAE
jgi:thiamine pyrophosphokinase